MFIQSGKGLCDTQVVFDGKSVMRYLSFEASWLETRAFVSCLFLPLVFISMVFKSINMVIRMVDKSQ